MTDATPPADPLDDLTEEFARRCRAGEQPSVEDYAARHPQWAGDIRDLFPAILLMEQFKPQRDEQPPAAGPSAVPLPHRLGEYRLLREIGRGGMGVVYEARHETLARRVAIKVLPAHLFADDKLRARFRREAQAAARLHHTNIVPVFDVGEQDGLHYYVMQLISGRSLDAAPTRNADLETPHDGPHTSPCSEDRVPIPQLELSSRDVARIGAQVADALAYAHGQGVLHRDIKPSNLLLDERGTVWVTDFGVAKLVEEANLTTSGDLVGTLRYMPPERFAGTSDARGDVYSLGITLYELLARRPAFPEATPQHLIQLITQGEPAPLGRLDPTIPTDLETIVLKASARDPAYRYQTAAELADDLRRFLDDRPVKARRTSTAAHVWRWCRRNRLAAGSAAAAVLLLVVTTAVSVAAYAHTSAANRRTEAANEDLKKALAAEQDQRERSENTSAAALEAMNRIYDRFAPNRIVAAPSLPADGSTEERLDVPSPPTLPPEAVPLLEELLDFYEQFAREGSNHPRLQVQAAEANQRIGDIRQRLGRLDPAITAYHQALKLYANAPADTESNVRLQVVRTYNDLGQTLWASQRTDEARDAYSQALATVSAAPGEWTSRPECRYELARTYYLQSQREFIGEPPGPPPGGGPDHGRGRGPEGGRGPGRGPEEFDHGHPPGRGPGEPGHGPPSGRGPDGPPPDHGDDRAAQRAIDLLESLVKDHPAVPEYRHLLACCYRDAPPHGPRPVDGAADPAVKLLRQLVKDFPKVPDYRYDLAEALARRSAPGRPVRADQEAARRQLEEAVRLAGELADEYPGVPLYAVSRALAHHRLGSLLEQLEQRDEAERQYRKCLALQTALVHQHPEAAAYDLILSRIQRSLARLLRDRKEYTEARGLLETSAGRLGVILQKSPRQAAVRISLACTQRDLADVLERLGEHDLAAKALRRADEFGPPHSGDLHRPPPH